MRILITLHSGDFYRMRIVEWIYITVLFLFCDTKRVIILFYDVMGWGYLTFAKYKLFICDKVTGILKGG